MSYVEAKSSHPNAVELSAVPRTLMIKLMNGLAASGLSLKEDHTRYHKARRCCT